MTEIPERIKELESSGAEALGPRVGGGGGFAYFYTALPNLNNLRFSLLERLNTFDEKELDKFLGVTVDWIRFRAAINEIHVDLSQEGVREGVEFEQRNGITVLTSQFLEQINLKALSEPMRVYAVQVLSEIAFARMGLSFEADRLRDFSRLLLSAGSSCGLKGSFRERLESCRRWMKTNPEKGVIVQRITDAKQVSREVIWSEKLKKLYMMTDVVLNYSSFDEASRICAEAREMKSLGATWRLPSPREFRDLRSDHASGLVGFQTLGYLINLTSQFFTNKFGVRVSIYGQSEDLEADKARSAFGVAITAIMNPLALVAMGALVAQTKEPLARFTKKDMLVLCVADFDSAQSPSSSEDWRRGEVFAVEPTRFAQIEFKQAVSSSVSQSILRRKIQTALDRLRYVLTLVSESELNEFFKAYPQATVKSRSDLLAYLRAVVVLDDKLDRPQYRLNPNGHPEPLAFNYALAVNISGSTAASPGGIVFPVRGALMKYGRSETFSEDEQIELGRDLAHELSHLMGIGREDDRVSQAWAKYIHSWLWRYWETCGSMFSLEWGLQMCHGRTKEAGWAQTWKSKDRADRSIWDAREIVKSESTGRLWAFSGYVDHRSFSEAEERCKTLDSKSILSSHWRLPTQAEAEQQFWSRKATPETVFELSSWMREGVDLILNRCLFTQQGELSCLDSRERTLKIPLLDRFVVPEYYPVFCVSQ